MTTIDLLWRWLAQAAIFSGLLLLVGVLATWLVRPAADRLRIIQWVLFGCLIAPLAAGLSPWSIASLPLWHSPRDDFADNDSLASNSPTSQPVISSASDPIPMFEAENGRRAIPANSAAEVAVAEAVEPADQAIDAIHTSIVRDTHSGPAVDRSGSWHTWIVRGYVALVCGMSLWWCVGFLRRWLIESMALPAPDEVKAVFQGVAKSRRRNIRLLVSPQISGPMTWGLWRPVIIVPSSMVHATDAKQLRWCLAHETSHVERGDAWTLMLASAVQLVSFYQPHYWWLRRQMSLCQDFLADARAVAETGSAEDYADFLVGLARSQKRSGLPAALGMIDHKSLLFRRIQALVNSSGVISPRCSRLIAIGSAVLTIASLGLFSVIRLNAEDSTASKQKTNPPSVSTAQGPAKAGDGANETELQDGILAGVVVNAADGSPVAGATVVIHRGEKNTVQTDAQGCFEMKMRPIRNWDYPVWAYRGNLVAQKVIVQQLPANGSKIATFAPLRLEMNEGKQVKFLVTTEVTKQPVVGATVRFGYPDRRMATTGDDGVVVVQGLLAEEYEINTELQGYARVTRQIDLTRAASLTEYRLSLPPGGVVRGTVVDVAGKAIADAEISFRIENDHHWSPGDAPRTDFEGRFQHRFLPLNVPIKISAGKKGYLEQRPEVSLSTDRREQVVTVTLPNRPNGGSIAGVVTDDEGRPIAGAVVSNDGTNSDDHREAKTDDDGKFILHDLLKGSYRFEVTVSAQGFAPQLLEVQPGPEANPAQVAVKLKPGHTIRGRVLLENGQPAKGATVSMSSSAYSWRANNWVNVDDEGYFRADSLPENVKFYIQLKGYASQSDVRLKLDQEEQVVVTLEKPGFIRGRVIDAKTRQPVPEFRVYIEGSRDRRPGDPSGSWDSRFEYPGMTVESADGHFFIGPLTNGMPAALVVEQEGYERAIVPRAVASNNPQAEGIELVLTRLDPSKRFTLTGQFLDHAGKPKAGAQLRLIVSTDQPLSKNDNNFNWSLIKGGQLGRKSYCEQFLAGETNAEGRFRFANILPGKYLQLAYWGDGVPQRKSLAFDETKPGEANDVTIRLPEPAVIRGSFIRENFPDAGRVYLGSSGPNAEIPLKEGQSTFEFADLPPGSYTVGIITERSRMKDGSTYSAKTLARTRISLKAGQVETVEFLKPDPPQE